MTSLFSARWYRVADLKPRLRPQVRARRTHWRDQRWYQLTDEATGRVHRINEPAYRIVGRCDGQRTVQQIWDAVMACDGDNAATQDEVVDLLIGLHAAELMQFDRTPDIDALFQRHTDANDRRLRTLINPFSFRLPLGDPSRLLARFDGFGRRLFSAPVFWLWLSLVSVAVLVAGANWPELSAFSAKRMSSPSYLALIWGCYIVIKLIHELGHGLAVRRWHGEVHEAGISLLVLIPAPYVDASAAAGFLSRRQRALVSAAGIMAELALAGLGLFVWLLVEDGVIRDIAFATALIGSVSTLLFNGNPLLRFDGYYILSDVFDLPNLASRSNAYWNHQLRRRLLNLPSTPVQLGAGEQKWLIGYAPLSLAYRLIIALSIILWLAGIWLALAIATGLYFLLTMAIRPLWRWAAQSLDTAAPGAELSRTRWRIALLVLVPGFLLFILPLPHNTVAPAVVWLPDNAQLRPEVDGFIASLPVRDGATVEAGDLIVRLDNPDIVVEREKLLSRLQGLEAERYRLLLRDPVGAQNQAEVMARTKAELAHAEQRLAQLEVHAQTSGRLVMPRQSDLPGTYVKHGHPLGYVLAEGNVLIRATVPEPDIFLVQTQTRSASVQLAEASGRNLDARINIDTPAATYKLPSPALGDRLGGPFPTDPADNDGTQLLAPVFIVDLGVTGLLPQRIGERAWARFDHGYTPLAIQVYRRLTQLFLKHTSPTG